MTPEEQKELDAALEKKRALLRLSEHASLGRLEEIFHQRATGMYLRDVILGANDGIVTTFAVVSGVAGAALAPAIIVILGVANLFADGISMGAGVLLGERSEGNYNKVQRKKEEWEVENLRPIELQEVREILMRYGFTGADLERALAIITRNKKAWVDFMMIEELGIMDDDKSGKPAAHGLATFISFVLAGSIPLVPYLIPLDAMDGSRFLFSILLSFITLFGIGAARSKFSPAHWWKGGFEMLIVGALAGAAAYAIGAIIGSFV